MSMGTDEIASEARELILELLADGEWRSHRQIVRDLIRTPMSEYAIRSILRGILDDQRIEVEDRRNSHRHIPAWWYRARG